MPAKNDPLPPSQSGTFGAVPIHRRGQFTCLVTLVHLGGGVYATKYAYNTSKFFGYLGTVSVPLAGAGACPAIIKNFRMTGYNGAASMLRGQLFQRTGNLSAPIATVPVTSPGYFDITQSAGNFAATPSIHSLAIELLGNGQGVSTITALFVELQY